MKLKINSSDRSFDIYNECGIAYFNCIYGKTCSSITVSLIDYPDNKDRIYNYIKEHWNNIKLEFSSDYDLEDDSLEVELYYITFPNSGHDAVLVISETMLILNYDTESKGADKWAKGIINELVKHAINKSQKTKNNSIDIISSYGSGLCTNNYKINIQNNNLEDNYDKPLVEVYPKIKKFVESDKSGLILMHGDMGTGKTSYIRKLIEDVDKQFIYIPKDLFQSITMPSFTTFLSSITDAVFIIEDCEDLLCVRDGIRNSVVSELLNFTDGLLSDMFRLTFICTFNSSISKIDPALTRAGRLFADLTFDSLSVDKTNKLYKKLNIDKIVTSPTPLSDIYGDSKEIIKSIQITHKIGF